MKQSLARFACLLAVAAFAAAPAMAGDDTILAGIDLWTTPADGNTFADFESHPIPADYFCVGSRAFTGKIVFTGTPVKTFPESAYGATDTIIHRLEDATFNEDGVAFTPIQVAALSFRSVEPFVNECGMFDVTVRLSGEQPVTQMRIVKSGHDGGNFEAPLDINVIVEFSMVNRRGLAKGVRYEFPQEIRFAPNRGAVWTRRVGKGGVRHEGTALVDTNNDGEIDTELPGTTNFAAGWVGRSGAGLSRAVASCHCNPILVFPEEPTPLLAAQPQPCLHLHCPTPPSGGGIRHPEEVFLEP